ncbi:MAG: NusG domain II-containing protein [Oscillospiraceae bacterium]|nr:NusG domain II-containing protein [Oscillospiraceae bacterium]
MAKEVFPLDSKPELSLKLLLGGILLLAAAALGCLLLFSGRGAATAEVYRDGKLVQRIDLGSVSEPYTLDIGEGNTIEVERGRIRMLRADCPDQICVHQSWSASAAKPIVCLPNRVTVILAGGQSDPDGVLG